MPRRRAPDAPRGDAASTPSCAGSGTRRPCSCAARVPGFAGLVTRRRAAGAGTARRRRVATRRSGRRALVASRRARSGARLQGAARARLDAAGPGREPAFGAADALLRRFAFLPYARLDDLMVSYAAPGGGVGPHFDSYDVFLLQGFGRRRWRYGRQDDLELRPGLPVKILRRFAPARDEILVPGDMLYLPPQFAHDGVAVDACTTYSIGFRAASNRRDRRGLPRFPARRDRPPRPLRRPRPRADARAGARRRGDARQCAQQLARIRWDAATVARFLGAGCRSPSPRCSSTRRSTGSRAPRSPCRAAPRRAARPADATPLRRRAAVHQRRALGWPAAAPPRCAARERARAARPPPCRRCRRRASHSSTIGTAMDSSPPTPADARRAGAEHRAAGHVAEQIAAIDRLIGLARHIDQGVRPGLSETGWNSPARSEHLAAFLERSPHARLDIIVHDTRWIEASLSPPHARCCDAGATRSRSAGRAPRPRAPPIRW